MHMKRDASEIHVQVTASGCGCIKSLLILWKPHVGSWPTDLESMLLLGRTKMAERLHSN